MMMQFVYLKEGIMPRTQLKRKILEKLENHFELDASDIKIDVNDGFVSLSGISKTVDDKNTIEALIESIDGVKDIFSDIEIESGTGLDEFTI
jgi:osmotically-inducible protein OsmY